MVIVCGGDYVGLALCGLNMVGTLKLMVAVNLIWVGSWHCENQTGERIKIIILLILEREKNIKVM